MFNWIPQLRRLALCQLEPARDFSVNTSTETVQGVLGYACDSVDREFLFWSSFSSMVDDPIDSELQPLESADCDIDGFGSRIATQGLGGMDDGAGNAQLTTSSVQCEIGG